MVEVLGRYPRGNGFQNAGSQCREQLQGETMGSISVVLGTRNRQDVLRKCLDSLIGRIEADHSIIVIDAGSTDGTLEYLQGLEGITLYRDEKPIGQAQSLNRVLKTVETDYVCWLSDDNVVVDGMLDKAVKILDDHNDIGMVTLKTKDVTGPLTELPYIGGIWTSGILNCNQGVIRTPQFLEGGGFDEDFRDYGIDADLTTRVLLAGYKVVYTREVAIHHYRDHTGESWTDPVNRSLRQEKARNLYEQRYSGLIKSAAQGLSPRITWAIASRLLRLAIRLTVMTRHLGNPLDLAMENPECNLEQLTGYNERDFFNICRSKYISMSDLIKNRHESYYLVQRIPERVRGSNGSVSKKGARQ